MAQKGRNKTEREGREEGAGSGADTINLHMWRRSQQPYLPPDQQRLHMERGRTNSPEKIQMICFQGLFLAKIYRLAVLS